MIDPPERNKLGIFKARLKTFGEKDSSNYEKIKREK